MAIFLFSILVLIGFIPAVFLLDRLFAIHFEKSPLKRKGTKGVFWQPRGFADTGSEVSEPTKRRPLMEGFRWLFSAPESLSSEQTSKFLLRAYRVCVLFVVLTLIVATAYFIRF